MRVQPKMSGRPKDGGDRSRGSQQSEQSSTGTPLGANCSECPFAVESRPPHRPVFATGPSSALGLIVAESPGSEEVEVGRPLVGPTGRAFDDELFAAGLKRAELFLINATLCQPRRGKTEGEMQQAVDACHPAFLKQIEKLPDEIPTLAMGRWAHYALRGISKGVYGERGFVRREFELPRER